jgi:hypothetical protein
LKKAGATIAAESGATTRQLMAMFDWTTESMAEVDTRAAEKKRLAGQAMFLIWLDRNGNENCRADLPGAVAPREISEVVQVLANRLAGVAGLEPATPGFGDRCSTN